MEYLICYDIVEDDLRFAVADICMNNGFVRIQYSVFFGSVSRNKAESTLMEIKDKIKGFDAAVLLIELCEKCAKRKRIIVSVSKNEKEKAKVDECKHNSDNATSDEDLPTHKDTISEDTESSPSKAKDNLETNENTKGQHSVRKKRKRNPKVSIERLTDVLNKGVIIL